MRIRAHACGLSPDEFWNMTPYELALVLQGHAQRQRSWLEVAAWHLSGVLSMVSKHPVRPRSLLRATTDIRTGGAAILEEAKQRWLFEAEED